MAKKAPVSQAKAKMMMREGTVHGKPMTGKQKGLFGMIAGGEHPTRMMQRYRMAKGGKK